MEFEDFLYDETELPEQPDDDIGEGGGFIDFLLWLIQVFSN